MKKLCLILTLALVGNTLAQESNDSIAVSRFFYSTKILKDPQKTDQITEGVAILDINQSNSRFTDYGSLQRSEFMTISKTDKSLSRMDIMNKLRQFKSGFAWSIYSNADENKFYLEQSRQKYYYKEDKNSIKWTIAPEVTQWEGYKVQEATTSYGGRVWYALFTTDIPALNGPYKFNNLPGFVVKAWDAAGEYAFEFTNSQNIKLAKDALDGLANYEEVSKKQAKKADKVFYNKTAVDLLIELNPGNAKNIDQYPAGMKQKLILSSNPIEKDF